MGQLALKCGEPALNCGELALRFDKLALKCCELALNSGELALKHCELALKFGEFVLKFGELARRGVIKRVITSPALAQLTDSDRLLANICKYFEPKQRIHKLSQLTKLGNRKTKSSS